jgi:hypothetical protein
VEVSYEVYNPAVFIPGETPSDSHELEIGCALQTYLAKR